MDSGDEEGRGRGKEGGVDGELGGMGGKFNAKRR
jgi:hypothetical protein